MTFADDFITVARVVKTQGRRGEVAAVILTDFPEKFSERKHLYVLEKAGATRELHVANRWTHKSYIVFKFAGIDTITDAKALIGCELQIRRSERSKLDADAVYVGDLVGCTLIDVAGSSREIGHVSDVDSTSGEAPNLVVMSGKKEFLVPFAHSYLRNIDLNAKRIEMALPEGLLEVDAPLSSEEKAEQKKTTQSPDGPIIRFHLITIFPDFFRGPLDYGIVRRSREAGLVEIGIHDLRAHTRDRHKTVDDRPFGGGEGMVLKPEPIFECVESLGVSSRESRLLSHSGRTRSIAERERRNPYPDQKAARETVILLSASGQLFDQKLAHELGQLDRIVLICGRYEGVDERVSEALADREVSIGNFVLSGGEVAAAIVVDAVTRLIPGALGNEASAHQESFTASTTNFATSGGAPSSTCGSGGLLDYPHYTRPADFRGMGVPETLSSGNHDVIRKWRRRKALEKTLRNRPDLLQSAELTDDDRQVLKSIQD